MLDAVTQNEVDFLIERLEDALESAAIIRHEHHLLVDKAVY